MKLLATLLVSAYSTNNGFKIVREKSDQPQAKCEELGGTLATLEEDHDLRHAMGSGRHTVAGATRPGAKYAPVFVDTGSIPYTWYEARDYCANLGHNWGLAIVNNEEEYNSITQFVNANCYSKNSIWLGHQYRNDRMVTQYGKDDFWNGLNFEPLDGSREVCIQLIDGQVQNVRCGKAEEKMGFVCEAHTHFEKCQPKDEDDLPTDNRYFLSEASSITWSQARGQCKLRGLGWDLAVIGDSREHRKLVNMANCSKHAYWVGHRETDNVVTDINDNLSTYFSFSDIWDKDEPNDQTGIEQCVRLMGDKFRDAKCDLTSSDHARSGLGMGYICEFDETKATPVAAPNSVELLECSHNKNLRPFVPKGSCPKPVPCEEGPRLQITDSWKSLRNGKWNYGMVGTVHIPEDMASKSWSVLVRFSPLVGGSNFQTWNVRYWNFYNNNREVLFHKKWWTGGDRADENSFSFVVDNLNQPEYPEVVGFNTRVTNHGCFQGHQASGLRSGASAFMQELIHKVQHDNQISSMQRSSDMEKIMSQAAERVTKIKTKKSGKIRIRGKVLL